MPLILLIRHGHNDYVEKKRLAGRLPDVHLNEDGRAQAKALGERLAEARLKAVYSSPLERTMETARPIAQASDLEVVPREGLTEIDYGTWQGKTLKQLGRRKLWPVVQQQPSLARFPEGESFAEAQVRLVSEIEALCGRHKPKDAFACVSHSDAIKLIVAYYIGLPLDQFQRLSVAPASITTLHIGEKHARLINLNSVLTQPGQKPQP